MELENVRGYLRTKDGRAWHRIVYRETYGRIPKGWHIHHINGRSLDNDPKNLIALPERLHVLAHKQVRLPKREELEQWLKGILPEPKKKERKKKKSKREKQVIPLKPYTIKDGLTHAEAVEEFKLKNNIKVSRKLKIKY